MRDEARQGNGGYLYPGKMLVAALVLDEDCQVKAQIGDMGEGMARIKCERGKSREDGLQIIAID